MSNSTSMSSSVGGMISPLLTFIVTIVELFAWDCCMFLDGDEQNSGVGGGVLCDDSSLQAKAMSVSSIIESS